MPNTRPKPSTPDPNYVHALAKGLEILSAFAEGEMLGNQELVAHTGMPKATVSRLTSTLVSLGYLRVDPASRKLLMGTRLLGMGASVQRRIGLQRIARPFMERLSRETELTVSLATRDRLGMVVLEFIRPPNSVRLVTNIDAGTVLPIPNTSLGLAYLVGAPVKERAQLLQALSKRYGEDWPRLRQDVETAHQEYERHGWVLSQRSWGRDVTGVGVPLQVETPKGVYAFHCAGPSASVPLARIRKDIGPRLVRMVDDVRIAMRSTQRPRLSPPQIHEP
jgi:DNA-binding IclR family transcriptional regulator